MTHEAPGTSKTPIRGLPDLFHASVCQKRALGGTHLKRKRTPRNDPKSNPKRMSGDLVLEGWQIPRSRANGASKRMLPNPSDSIWSMYGICIKYNAWYSPASLQGHHLDYVWNMHGIGTESAWNMYGICMEYEWNMHGKSTECVWIVHWICM